MPVNRAAEIAELKRAHDEYIALRETVARICRALPNGVPLRTLGVLAEAKQKIERRAS